MLMSALVIIESYIQALPTPAVCRAFWSSSDLEFSWEITPNRLERCKHPDGSDFRLGYAAACQHCELIHIYINGSTMACG